MKRPVLFAGAAILAGQFLVAGMATHALAQPAITSHKTPGGIAFRHAHMPRAQMQAIQFGWKNGHALMLPGGGAISSLGAVLMLQGPRGMARGEFVEDTKDLQARMQLSASAQFTQGGIIAPPDKFDATVDLFARVLSEPALNPAHLDEIRQNSLLGHRRLTTTPTSIPARAAASLALAPGPLRTWALGDPGAIGKVRIEDIDAWRKAILVREGLVVSVAGPHTPEVAAAQIDRLFAGLPATGTRVGAVVPPEVLSAKTLVVEMPTPQTILHFSVSSRFMSTPESTRGSLAMNILRQRIFDAVRTKLGASYGATAQLSAYAREPMHVSVQAAVDHEKAAEALEAMRAQYKAFVTEGVTPQELEPEKTKLISSFREQMRQAGGVAQAVRLMMFSGYRMDFLATNVARIESMTAGEVNDDISEKLAGFPVLTVIVAPSAAPFKADCVVKSLAEIARCQ